MNQKATIKVPSLKLTLPLRPNQLPADLVPMDGPPGEPILELVLEGSPLTIVAKINGKNYRKMTKTVAEHGVEAVAIILQGNLKPGIKSGSLALDSAGFSVQIKTPKPTPTQDPGEQPE